MVARGKWGQEKNGQVRVLIIPFKGTPQWPNSLTLILTSRRFHHYQIALYSYVFNIQIFGDPIYNKKVSRKCAIKLKTMAAESESGGIQPLLLTNTGLVLYAVKWANSSLCFWLSWQFIEYILGKCLQLHPTPRKYCLSICSISKGNCTKHALIHVLVGFTADRKYCEGS